MLQKTTNFIVKCSMYAPSGGRLWRPRPKHRLLLRLQLQERGLWRRLTTLPPTYTYSTTTQMQSKMARPEWERKAPLARPRWERKVPRVLKGTQLAEGGLAKESPAETNAHAETKRAKKSPENS